MIVVGLTGSIAMGKSETARMFAASGIPVFDSDAAVHALYAKGGDAVEAIAAIAPEAVRDNAVDRTILARLIQRNPALLKTVEEIVHPLVQQRQAAFLQTEREQHAAMAVLDIPLLFETGRNRAIDKVVVVSASPEIQRMRALERPGMSPEKLDLILSRQLPDQEKRARADYVVDTSISLADAKSQVDRIITELLNRPANTHDP